MLDAAWLTGSWVVAVCVGRSGAKVVITCDAVYRGTKLVPLYETMVRRREGGRHQRHHRGMAVGDEGREHSRRTDDRLAPVCPACLSSVGG